MRSSDIIDRLHRYYDMESSASPVYSNRASQLGHPCLRKLVYDRLYWSELPKPSLKAQIAMREGKQHELALIHDLMQAGFEIIDTQKFLFWDKFNLSAKIDFKIYSKEDKKSYICEVKSVSDYTFNYVNSLESLINAPNKKFWLKMYPAQIMVYLLLEGRSGDESGFLIFKNRNSGELKGIDVNLDYDYAESLLKKCETIEQCVKNQAIPDGVEDYDICNMCAWVGKCLPSADFGDGAQIITDTDIIEKLNRREELKPLVAEYEDIDKALKEYFDGIPLAIAGDFVITGKEVVRNVRPREARQVRFWQTKIIKKSQQK